VTKAAGGRKGGQGGQVQGRPPAPSGLVIVDKPQGLTSHDVVARVRRLAGTRRVGHAGTLDPMATGVLVIGVEKATRLLGHLALTEKEYSATIRLGQATDTDDADGQVTAEASAAGVSQTELEAAVATLTGDIEQVPPGYSAIKVAGKRAYKLAREGAAPELAARTVTVTAFTVLAVRRVGDLLDADVTVTCSSGTYIRALARDVGRALGVGGHLTALRRTRVGPYEIAATLDELSTRFTVTPLDDAARVAFRPVHLTEDQARAMAHGGRIAIEDLDWPAETTGPIAAFAPDGSLIALLTEQAGQARPLAVFVG
jgi:tRNA pseudouridine55 synthase